MTWVSSVDLLQRLSGFWTEKRPESACRGRGGALQAVQAAFAYIGGALDAGNRSRVRRAALPPRSIPGARIETDDPPLCAVNAMTRSPLRADRDASSGHHRGDFVLIDAWCRKAVPGSIYADITWVAVADTRCPRSRRGSSRSSAGARPRDRVSGGKIPVGRAGARIRGRSGLSLAHCHRGVRAVLFPPHRSQHRSRGARDRREPRRLREPRHPTHSARLPLLGGAGDLSPGSVSVSAARSTSTPRR